MNGFCKERIELNGIFANGGTQYGYVGCILVENYGRYRFRGAAYSNANLHKNAISYKSFF